GLKNSANLVWELVALAHKAGRAEKDEALSAMDRNEFAEAVTHLDSGMRELGTAKEALTILKQLKAGAEDIAKKTIEIDAEIGFLEAKNQTAAALRALHDARKLRKTARDHLREARKEPARLLKAQEAMQEAVVQFEAAK